MYTKSSEQAARITGPISAADATMRTGVWRIALTGSAQNVALPTSGAAVGKKSTLGARFVRLLAKGANVQFVQGTGSSAPTVTLNQVSVMGTGHVGAGMTLLDGVPEVFLVDSDSTYFAWISDAATGYLEMIVSDQPVP